MDGERGRIVAAESDPTAKTYFKGGGKGFVWYETEIPVNTGGSAFIEWGKE